MTTENIISNKMLGKISSVRFGYGGYQDAQFGLSLQFSGDGWGCGTFRGAWGGKRSSSAKWTEEDRIKSWGEMVQYIEQLLSDSNKKELSELKGVPVEVSFVGNTFESFRILKEVI